tara:strand:+ start:15326 stop:15826 length:501 start_codon:yes stop_codon:yes gene_type:complete
VSQGCSSRSCCSSRPVTLYHGRHRITPSPIWSRFHWRSYPVITRCSPSNYRLPVIFLLDTGANRTIIRDSRLSHCHIERAESQGQTRLINLQDIERGRAHDINSISINDISFPLNQILSANLDHLLDPIESVSTISIDGVLGMDALLSLGTLLDIRTVTLYIEPIK